MAGTLWKIDDDLIISAKSVTIKTHSANSTLAEPSDTTQLTLTTSAHTSAQVVGIPAGTVSLPGLAFSADLDTGIYRIGANDLGIAVGGALVQETKSVGVYVTGNGVFGAVGAFGSTEPVSATTYKQGTEGAGAVTTAGGIWTNGTVMRKIIAAGTVSNIET